MSPGTHEVSSRKFALLTVVILVLGAVLFLFPLPNNADQMHAAKTAMLGGGLAIVGNSVASHVSNCDTDQRPLSTMVAMATRRAESDLGFPGQSLDQEINFAALAVANPRIEKVVVLVSLAQFEYRRRQDLRSDMFFRLTAGDYQVNDIGARLRRLEPITSGFVRQEDPFSYGGKSYPDYNGVKQRYMLPEREAMRCPETLGQDRAFIEALYWNYYLREPLDSAYIADLTTLAGKSRVAAKPVLFVLMPIDLQDVTDLNPALAAAIRTRRDQFLDMSRKAGLPILDLSESLPASAFADRWCGCGHLVESGRQALSARIATAAEVTR